MSEWWSWDCRISLDFFCFFIVPMPNCSWTLPRKTIKEKFDTFCLLWQHLEFSWASFWANLPKWLSFQILVFSYVKRSQKFFMLPLFFKRFIGYSQLTFSHWEMFFMDGRKRLDYSVTLELLKFLFLCLIAQKLCPEKLKQKWHFFWLWKNL